ncbi:MAG TPA: Do family serine endopeptidase [Burkholderiaceae bacterium]|nr:Do family serine endopeptidase [Burkholderiaceae bacterium]
MGMVASPAIAQPVTAAPSRALPDFTELVDRVGPAVVNIRTTERIRQDTASRNSPFPNMPDLDENDPLYDFFRRFFPPQQPNPRQAPRRGGDAPQEQEVPRGVGSGFIISADGYVMTNAHVVQGADDVYVTLPDKREFKAKIIGADKRSDVAIVKIDATSLPKVTIGDVGEVKVGQWVVAIGSPFGLDNTVTAGIVSAKGRDTGDLVPFIQTDVAVNPGNSGGPLINLKGEVIGINSQIYSRTGGFMGISFAIPIDEAMRVTEQLRAVGRVTRGRIGVGIEDLSKELADTLNVKQTGVLIRQVERGGPAEKAGVEPGDILLKWQGRAIDRAAELRRAVANTRPGTSATIQVWRRGQLRDLNVTVAELDPERAAASTRGTTPDKPKAGAESNALGLVVTDLNAARRHDLRVSGGVLVESAEGAAARAGLRAGDVILSVNNAEVANAKQFNDMVTKLDRSKPAVLLVRRGGDTAQFVTIRPNGK